MLLRSLMAKKKRWNISYSVALLLVIERRVEAFADLYEEDTCDSRLCDGCSSTIMLGRGHQVTSPLGEMRILLSYAVSAGANMRSVPTVSDDSTHERKSQIQGPEWFT